MESSRKTATFNDVLDILAVFEKTQPPLSEKSFAQALNVLRNQGYEVNTDKLEGERKEPNTKETMDTLTLRNNDVDLALNDLWKKGYFLPDKRIKSLRKNAEKIQDRKSAHVFSGSLQKKLSELLFEYFKKIRLDKLNILLDELERLQLTKPSVEFKSISAQLNELEKLIKFINELFLYAALFDVALTSAAQQIFPLIDRFSAIHKSLLPMLDSLDKGDQATSDEIVSFMRLLKEWLGACEEAKDELLKALVTKDILYVGLVDFSDRFKDKIFDISSSSIRSLSDSESSLPEYEAWKVQHINEIQLMTILLNLQNQAAALNMKLGTEGKSTSEISREYLIGQYLLDTYKHPTISFFKEWLDIDESLKARVKDIMETYARTFSTVTSMLTTFKSLNENLNQSIDDFPHNLSQINLEALEGLQSTQAVAINDRLRDVLEELNLLSPDTLKGRGQDIYQLYKTLIIFSKEDMYKIPPKILAAWTGLKEAESEPAVLILKVQEKIADMLKSLLELQRYLPKVPGEIERITQIQKIINMKFNSLIQTLDKPKDQIKRLRTASSSARPRILNLELFPRKPEEQQTPRSDSPREGDEEQKSSRPGSSRRTPRTHRMDVRRQGSPRPDSPRREESPRPDSARREETPRTDPVKMEETTGTDPVVRAETPRPDSARREETPRTDPVKIETTGTTPLIRSESPRPDSARREEQAREDAPHGGRIRPRASSVRPSIRDAELFSPRKTPESPRPDSAPEENEKEESKDAKTPPTNILPKT